VLKITLCFYEMCDNSQFEKILSRGKTRNQRERWETLTVVVSLGANSLRFVVGKKSMNSIVQEDSSACFRVRKACMSYSPARSLDVVHPKFTLQ
jgi:hypothetical protein